VPSLKLFPLTGDAGFRKYYRFSHHGESFIAVDALPDKSNNVAFVELQKAFKKQNVQVPEIITVDLDTGFFCLSDFGDELFGDVLTEDNMNVEYKRAIDLLPEIAAMSVNGEYKLPNYDGDFVRVELGIFTEWLLTEHLNLSLNEQESLELNNCFDVLVNNVLEQPQVVMHRDFHSRNLMDLSSNYSGNYLSNYDGGKLGVIDFQDAVHGPITYDIVSLLRDCYVKWPAKSVDSLFNYFCSLMQKNESYKDITHEQWARWFDLMGIQRHVKASGIFARLYHRDSKQGYLKDIPLTLSYIVDIAAKYPELKPLNELVSQKVIPALNSLKEKI
jgi:aminoglycoside/choline kinase family phosphotransferase